MRNVWILYTQNCAITYEHSENQNQKKIQNSKLVQGESKVNVF